MIRDFSFDIAFVIEKKTGKIIHSEQSNSIYFEKKSKKIYTLDESNIFYLKENDFKNKIHIIQANEESNYIREVNDCFIVLQPLEIYDVITKQKILLPDYIPIDIFNFSFKIDTNKKICHLNIYDDMEEVIKIFDCNDNFKMIYSSEEFFTDVEFINEDFFSSINDDGEKINLFIGRKINKIELIKVTDRNSLIEIYKDNYSFDNEKDLFKCFIDYSKTNSLIFFQKERNNLMHLTGNVEFNLSFEKVRKIKKYFLISANKFMLFNDDVFMILNLDNIFNDLSLEGEKIFEEIENFYISLKKVKKRPLDICLFNPNSDKFCFRFNEIIGGNISTNLSNLITKIEIDKQLEDEIERKEEN